MLFMLLYLFRSPRLGRCWISGRGRRCSKLWRGARMRCWYAAGTAGADGASSTASVSTAVGAAGSQLAQLARRLAQMAWRAQLALMGAAGNPTAAHATGALQARPVLLPHERPAVSQAGLR